MKHTLNTHQVASALSRDENAKWSPEACLALAEYYIEYDEQHGTDTELDVVAIRCTWSEYDSLKAVAADYRIDAKGTAAIARHLNDRTQWVMLENGHVLVMQF